ncbi:MAG: PilN domain-containing protein [Myxococcales bacterium]|nr:PilN domain-containing protein [Myxococcales bacterium]
MLRRSLLALTLLSTSALAGDLADAVRRVTPKGLATTVTRSVSPRVVVTGRAKTHEEVSEFMRATLSLISTPKGWGRVVERSAREVRIELFEQAVAPIEDFRVEDVAGVALSGLRVVNKGGVLAFTFRVSVKRKPVY